MPELAEVEYYRKQWDAGIGQVVQAVRIHPKARIFRDLENPASLNTLEGTRLLSSKAHGKQMGFLFSGHRFLGVHLGMAGRLLTATTEIVPSKHEHLVFILESVALVFSDYRMFGKILQWEGENPPWWRDLPPQPQDEAFDPACFKAILDRRGKAPLKAVLLDQSCFPGIGNWMADEILWRARIHPADRASDLPPRTQTRLFKEVKAVAKDALEVIGTNWGDPPDSWLFNHRWKPGLRCPVSGKPLARETIGGRTTCFSPAIQKPRRQI